jgi:hypothetical protein
MRDSVCIAKAFRHKGKNYAAEMVSVPPLLLEVDAPARTAGRQMTRDGTRRIRG